MMIRQKINIVKLTIRTRRLSAEQTRPVAQQLPQSIAETLAQEASLRGLTLQIPRVAIRAASATNITGIAAQVGKAVVHRASSPGSDGPVCPNKRREHKP